MEKQNKRFRMNGAVRRVLSLCMALCMILTLLPVSALTATAAAEEITVYLKPNSNWNQAGARFAVYYWSDSVSSAWVDMTDADGDGVYECRIPSGCSLIFCRMNPGAEANIWDNTWNQTADLAWGTYSDGDLFTMPANSWNGANTGWSSDYQPPEIWTEVDTEEELIEALTNGGNVRLMADIDLYREIFIGYDTKLDLNSHSIYGLYDEEEGSYGDLYISRSAPGTEEVPEVVLTDLSEEKTGAYVYDEENYAGMIYLQDCIVTFEYGSYGNVRAQEYEELKVTLEEEAHIAYLSAKGGTFNFDPSDSIWFDGYAAVDNEDGTWTVVRTAEPEEPEETEPEETEPGETEPDGTWTEVDTEEELIEALTNGGNVRLMADIDLYREIKIGYDIKLDLNSHSIYGLYDEEESSFGDLYIGCSISDTGEVPEVVLTDLSEEKTGAYVYDGENGAGIVYLYDCVVTFEYGSYDRVFANEYEELKVTLEEEAYIDLLQVVGGTFNFDPTDYIVHGSLEAVDNEDGTWTVVRASEPEEPEEEEPADVVLYLRPNSEWKNDNARFAAYYWSDSVAAAWADMTDDDGDGVYEVVVPEGSSVIFCRMNPGTTDNNWNNKWNQSPDLSVPTDGTNCYEMNAGSWSEGTWTVYTPGEEPLVSPVIEGGKVTFLYENDTATKVEVFGGWNGWASSTELTKNSEGLWTAELELPNGTYEYKFVVNGSDWITDPANSETANGNSVFTVTEEEEPGENECTVTLHFLDTLSWGSVKLHGWYRVGTVDTGITGAWPGIAVEKDADGFHTATITEKIPGNASFGYIFNNGNGTQTVDLFIPAADLADGEEELWVVPGTTTDGKYECTTYPSADAIVISPVVDGMNVTFKYSNPEADKVEVLGSWSSWVSATALTKNSYGIWSATVEMDDYGDYEYKFIVDGRWVADPANSWTSDGGNSMVRIVNPDAADLNKIVVNVYYNRADGIYETEDGVWNLYAWADSMGGTRFDFEENEEGEMVTTIELDGRSNLSLGMKTRLSNAGVDWVQEESEVKVNLASIVSGTIDVYIESSGTQGNKGELTASQIPGTDVSYKNKITDVQLDYDSGIVTIKTQSASAADYFELVHIGTDGKPVKVNGVSVSGSGTSFTMTMPDNWNWDLTKLYQYKVHFLQAKEGETDFDYYDIGIASVYSSTKFNSEFTYTGDDLGATYTEASTTFKVWAPTAEQVNLKLYATGSDEEVGAADLGSYVMERGEDGVWTVSIDGDLDSCYYTYEVKVDGETVEACDPYARTTGVNGQRAMVIDLDTTDPADGWTSSGFAGAYTDAIIYELHVRDFSIDDSSGVSTANRGKFTAFTETGSTAMQHLTGLGITHLHLLPIYDYGSVDETKCDTFNWGYDPVNYNVPEGSYSTNPYNGYSRVEEMKEMVDTLHEEGISVIMDVVYNHVYDAGKFCFNQIVPGYFSRFNSSRSGCGNDTASERTMVRKYIVDSVTYLAEEYHLDGFRFDLVGLVDVITINQIVTEVHKINPYAVFYGEGWEMDSTNTDYDIDLAKQGNAPKTPGFAYFSDSMRNLLGGENGHTLGFVSGLTGQEETLRDNFLAKPWWTSNPAQVVQYASCHDNYTLIDKLILSTGKIGIDADIIRMNNLAAAIYMTAQGIPFIHAGEDFLREKINEGGYRVENSYNSPDNVNHIEWSNLEKEEYADTSAYYQGLIAFRKAHPILQNNAVTTYKWITNEVVQFTIAGPNETIVLIFNGNNSSQAVSLPEGSWNVYINGEDAGTESLGIIEGDISIDPISALVLVESSIATDDEHTFSDTWTYNNTHHWKECTCHDAAANITELGEHEFEDGICTCGAKLADLPTGWALPGKFNGVDSWDDSYTMSYQNDRDTVTITMELNAGTHEFKVKNGGTWYGYDGTIAGETTGITMDSDGSAPNAKIRITEAGLYSFTYTISTKTLKVERTYGLIDISGVAMTLGNSLSMNIGIDASQLENGGEGHYAVITRHYASGKADDVVTVEFDDWKTYGGRGTIMTASYTKIAAKEMCDEVEIVVYNAAGEVVSNPYSDSVRDYAMRMLEDEESSAELKTMMVDMLNYGAAAQVFFGYNTEDLANNQLTEEQKGLATSDVAPENSRVAGAGYAGSTLTLESHILLDFVFEDSRLGTDMTGLYAVAEYVDHYGNEVSVEIEEFRTFPGNRHYVSVRGLAVADCGQLVTCTVYNSDGEVIVQATDSVESYVARQIAKGETDELYVAIMKFAASAYAYFH